MPKLAQEYITLRTKDLNEARKLIGFDVLRLPAFCELDGQKIPIPKESIFRKDPLVHYETLSPEYGLITHTEALDAMLAALRGYSHHLSGVTLECRGAEMTACFRIFDGKMATNIRPELILVNSYNCATSLGLKLGSFHEEFHHSALVPNGPSARWMHLGHNIDPEKIHKSIKECLDHFNKKVLPFYSQMAGWPASLEGIEKVIPKKMAKKLTQIYTMPAPNEWVLFNWVLGLIEQSKMTPSHRLHLLKKLSDWME